MTKAARRRPSRKLTSRLEAFYGANTCVVKDRTSKPNWHHLDEDPSNTVFHNLVPVDAGINQAIEYRADIEELDPAFLDVRSRHHLRASLYSRAYGCSRLGVSISSSRGHPDHAIRLASTAIRSLRPLGRVDLATLLLETAILPLLRDRNKALRVRYETNALLFDELALVHLEFGDPVRCDRCFRLAKLYLSGEPVQSPAWTQVLSQVLLHASFAKIEEGNIPLAVDRMRSAEEFGAMNRLARSASDSQRLLWKARVRLGDKDLDPLSQAIQRFESLRGEEIFSRRVPSLIRRDDLYQNVWMEAALLIVKAELEFRQGRVHDAFDKVEDIGRLFADGIHPTRGSRLPVVAAFGERSRDQSFMVPLVRTEDRVRFETICDELLAISELHAASVRVLHAGRLTS